MKRFTTVFLLLIAATFSFLSVTATAGPVESNDQIRGKLVGLLGSTGNSGTEFYTTFVPCYEVAGNNRIMLYVACATKTKFRVEVEGKGFILDKYTVANDVVAVELSPGIGQPFDKSPSEGSPPEQIYAQSAIHIKSGGEPSEGDLSNG